MFTFLPQTSEAFEQASWAAIESWYGELTATTLTQETLYPWMEQWSQLSALLDETMSRLALAVHQDSADEGRAQRKQRFVDEIFTPLQSYEQQYAFAVLGAFQVWHNYLIDPQNAMRQYRYALSLGATRTVPELYAAIGATFTFSEEVLRQMIQSITQTITELEAHL